MQNLRSQIADLTAERDKLRAELRKARSKVGQLARRVAVEALEEPAKPTSPHQEPYKIRAVPPLGQKRGPVIPTHLILFCIKKFPKAPYLDTNRAGNTVETEHSVRLYVDF